LYGATFTPNGKWVLTNSWNYTVVAWDAITGQRVEMPGVGYLRARGIVFSTDGTLLAAATSEHAVELRTAHTGELCFTLRGHATTIRSLSFSHDGTILASGSWDGEICLWDTKTGVCLTTLRAPGPYAAMNITGATGISEAQKAALQALGAMRGG
jgi:WD40 repeat protein